MKAPIVFADFWGMPPMGVGILAVLVFGFLWLCIGQINSMRTLIRQNRWGLHRIIREFCLGLGNRFSDFTNDLARQIYRLLVSLFCGYILSLALIYFTQHELVSYSVGGVVALLVWFGFPSSGGGSENEHKRGRLPPTHRDL